MKSLVKLGSLVRFCCRYNMMDVQGSARPPERIVRGAVLSLEFSKHLLVLNEPQAMRSNLLLCEYYDQFIDP